MAKKLKYSKIDLVERVGALMLVTFLDDQGNMYQWAPKWKDVEHIFLKQINIERFNKPESEWLNKFAQTTRNVVEGAQRINSAYKVNGQFIKYENEALVIVDNSDELRGYEHNLVPGFDVTIDFIDYWLDKCVEALIINDIVIRLRMRSSVDNIVDEYPPVEQDEPSSDEDLPF